jgi:predicted Zn-dependent peptidase
MRALRQLLGVWRKSEQLVPATFRQPTPPDPRTLIINAPADQGVEIRFAMRGFSRQDSDAPATALLAVLARQRWDKLLPELGHSPVFVRHDAFALPGIFVMGASVDNLLAGKTLATAREVMQSMATSPVAPAELEQARSQVVALATKDLTTPNGVADAWLDVDTYGLQSVAEQIRALNAVSPSDLQRAAIRLQRGGAFASIVVGNSEVVKTQLKRYGKVEIMGEIDQKKETKIENRSDLNAKPKMKSPPKPE